MFRTVLGLVLVGACIMLAGCRMCRHPYDYTGPVYDGPQGSSSWQTRAGSVLDGRGTAPTYSEEYLPANFGEYQEEVTDRGHQGLIGAESQPGDVPGSAKIVSVTDRVLGDENEPIETSRMAKDSSPAPQPSAGWTARRPSSTVR